LPIDAVTAQYQLTGMTAAYVVRDPSGTFQSMQCSTTIGCRSGQTLRHFFQTVVRTRNDGFSVSGDGIYDEVFAVVVPSPRVPDVIPLGSPVLAKIRKPFSVTSSATTHSKQTNTAVFRAAANSKRSTRLLPSSP